MFRKVVIALAMVLATSAFPPAANGLKIQRGISLFNWRTWRAGRRSRSARSTVHHEKDESKQRVLKIRSALMEIMLGNGKVPSGASLLNKFLKIYKDREERRSEFGDILINVLLRQLVMKITVVGVDFDSKETLEKYNEAVNDIAVETSRWRGDDFLDIINNLVEDVNIAPNDYLPRVKTYYRKTQFEALLELSAIYGRGLYWRELAHKNKNEKDEDLKFLERIAIQVDSGVSKPWLDVINSGIAAFSKLRNKSHETERLEAIAIANDFNACIFGPEGSTEAESGGLWKALMLQDYGSSAKERIINSSYFMVSYSKSTMERIKNI